MNLNQILLVVFALHFIGCSQQPAPLSGPSSSTESNSVIEPTDEDASSQKIQSTETKETIKAAMTLYREAQALMKAGKLEEGYEAAQKAMVQFVAEDDDLAWIMLESITVGDKRVDVHFNMGERERKMPEDGIVRPLSFRIWTGGDGFALEQVIDFEIGRSAGNSVTAAIGETSDSGHSNFGILDVDAPYESIRQSVVDFVTQE